MIFKSFLVIQMIVCVDSVVIIIKKSPIKLNTYDLIMNTKHDFYIPRYLYSLC